MKKIKITTPENIEVEYILADLGSRTAAVIIDMAIQGLIILLLAIAVLLISIYAPDFWDMYFGWIIGISLLVYTIISYGYYIVMELNMNGRTPGKKVLKLRTIRNNGQPLALKHSAIRNLFRVFIDMLGVGAVFIFFTKEHKRLGDYAASTIVVVEGNKTQPITLENLQNTKSHYNSIISEEEYELLREYLVRKNTMENPSELKDSFEHYFKNKYKESEVPVDLEKLFQ